MPGVTFIVTSFGDEVDKVWLNNCRSLFGNCVKISYITGLSDPGTVTETERGENWRTDITAVQRKTKLNTST